MTSLITTVNRSAAHDLVVAGDSDGYLRLFKLVFFFKFTTFRHFVLTTISCLLHRYPCINPKSEYNEEKCYGGLITGARFLYNDRNVVTVGGVDASLMLWDVVDE